MSEPKTILIVDDDELITMSLEMIISADPEFQVIGKGNSGEEAIRLYEERNPDLLLTDIRMPDMTGLDAAEKILSLHPDAVILFLTTFSDDEYIVKALKLGVKGYLLKQDYKSLPVSLRAALNGQSVFGGAVVDKLPELMSHVDKNNSEAVHGGRKEEKRSFSYREHDITEKEYEVIQLVGDGYSNKEIADKLFLSEGTVRNYLSSILEKLELRDRTQLAIFYLTNQILFIKNGIYRWKIVPRSAGLFVYIDVTDTYRILLRSSRVACCESHKNHGPDFRRYVIWLPE